jgi:hypothetical protein
MKTAQASEKLNAAIVKVNDAIRVINFKLEESKTRDNKTTRKGANGSAIRKSN